MRYVYAAPMFAPFISRLIWFHFAVSHFISLHLISSHLISSHLILSYLISSHFTSSHLMSSQRISPQLISSQFIPRKSSHVTSPPRLTSLISTSLRFTSSHLTSPHQIFDAPLDTHPKFGNLGQLLKLPLKLPRTYLKQLEPRPLLRERLRRVLLRKAAASLHFHILKTCSTIS